VIKYIGSKRTLVPLIRAAAAELPVRTACDLFAGTTRVGQALRMLGLEVVSNDLATYSEVLGQAYIAAGREVDRDRLAAVLAELAALPGRDGYFTEAFCRRTRYLQPHNGRRVDAIRDAVDGYELTAVERGIILTSLLEAADRVDSTTGLQMAYLKSWSPRSYGDLELRLPHPVPGPPGTVVRRDANELARSLDVDLVYVDPPYNQHSYFSNYHVWETLVRCDAPEQYGVAGKRVDCRERKSRYNSRREAPRALAELLAALEAPWLIVSFNDEGFHDPVRVEELLGARGHVARIDVDSKRYVGAQIGIYNPRGRRVGRISHLRNHEHLFVVGPNRARIDAVIQAVAASGSRFAAGAASAVAASRPAA
jgi:adenine-specific DNA-methyltransferase